MAAYEASIFKTLEAADKEIYTAFLNIAANRLHTQQGILSALFHPLDFLKPEKPFWERAASRLTEDDEKTRFAGWRLNGVKLKELNDVLAENNTFPDGIEAEDLTDFLYRENKEKILAYLFSQKTARLEIGYALQADLLNSMKETKEKLEGSLKEFCTEFNLDAETLKEYEKLSRLTSANLPPPKVKADSKKEGLLISAPKPIAIVEISDEQKQKFLACQEILLTRLNSLNNQKDDLNYKIRGFCSENSLSLEETINRIKQIIEFESQHEAMGLAPIIPFVEQFLMVEKQIYEIDLIKKALTELKYIDSYQKMIHALEETFNIDPNFAKKIIAICGHGLTKPYIAPLNEEQYRLFLERKVDTDLMKIRIDIYYKTAEKNISAIINKDPLKSTAPWPILALEYLAQIIELAPYDVGLLNSESIDYTISLKINAEATQILHKQTRIPDSLYRYYCQLKAFIRQVNLSGYEEQNFLAEIAGLLSALPENSIHHDYHRKFLYIIQDSIKYAAYERQEFKKEKLEASTPPSPVYADSLPLTFHSEDEKIRTPPRTHSPVPNSPDSISLGLKSS